MVEACCAMRSGLLSWLTLMWTCSSSSSMSRAPQQHIPVWPSVVDSLLAMLDFQKVQATEIFVIWNLVEGSPILLKDTSFGFPGEEASCFELGVRESDYLQKDAFQVYIDLGSLSFHVGHPLHFWQTTFMNQCCSSSKIADRHVKCGKKTGSVQRDGVWVRGGGVSQRRLFSMLPQTQEL